MQVEIGFDGFRRRPVFRRAPQIIAHQEVSDSGKRHARFRGLEKTVEPLQILTRDIEFGLRSEVYFGNRPAAERAVIPWPEDQLLPAGFRQPLEILHRFDTEQIVIAY